MGGFQELRDEAAKKLHIADYMLTMTYPIVKDPRLLLSVIENLFLAFSYGMSALLYYEKDIKNIQYFPDTFSGKLELFRDNCSQKYNIDDETLKIMQEIREILIAHKKSPIEFARKESLIICSGSYEMMQISANTIKGYVEKAKLFIKNVSAIISHEEVM